MSVAHVLAAAGAGAVVGLGSVPHCMGMCGPLVAGVCTRPREGLAYQAGRTLSYSALGALSGAVVALGTSPLAAGPVAALTSTAMAVGLVWAALRLVRTTWPAAASAQGTGDSAQGPRDRPDASGDDRALVELRAKPRASSRPGPSTRWARLVRPVLGSPLLVGALSALLPCAALLNLALVAGSSGGVATGAATGVAFATVTGGGLATSAWAAMLLRQTRAGSLVVAAVLVLGAAIVSVRAFPQIVGGRSTPEGAACHVEPVTRVAGATP